MAHAVADPIDPRGWRYAALDAPSTTGPADLTFAHGSALTVELGN